MKQLPNQARKALVQAARIDRISATALGLCGWLAGCLVIWLVLFALDNLFRLPAGLRFPMALAAAAAVIVGFVRNVCRPAFSHGRAEQTALNLEDRYAVPDNLLINAFQFEGRSLNAREHVFAQHTIEDSAKRISGIPMANLWRTDRIRKWGAGALLLLLLWLLYGVAFPRQLGNALARYVSPLGDVPPVGRVVLSVHPDANVILYEGDDLTVTAGISSTGTDSADLPLLVWREGEQPMPPVKSAGDNAELAAVDAAPGSFTYTFRGLRRSISFRVFAADTYSKSVSVKVIPLPKIKASAFRITPPAYTGQGVQETPGPPASLVVLPGSTVEIALETDQPVNTAVWRSTEKDTPFTPAGAAWTCRTPVDAAGPYDVNVTLPDDGRTVTLARGDVVLRADRPPQVQFLTRDRNRFVAPGETVDLDVEASDDFGIMSLTVTSRREGGAAEQGASGETEQRELKRWGYIGPPGRPGPLRERLSVEIDPRLFLPGETYIIQAVCYDFGPDQNAGRSRPIVLRVKSLEDLALEEGDALAAAFDLLKLTIEEQKKALAATRNVKTQVADILQAGSLPAQRQAILNFQTRARSQARAAVVEFRKHEEGAPYAGRLETLAEHEMGWVLGDIPKVEADTESALVALLEPVETRQAYILAELISMLGGMSGDSQARDSTGAPEDESGPPPITAEDAIRNLKEDLQDFIRAQKRIIRQSQTLMDKGPEDLTAEEESILGELAREESEWANFFEEKLTDFSKLPLQDFADGSLADEFNEVLQEIKLAAKSLYEKNIELAVPQEQAGVENAEELLHNLEKWLPDTPDNIKWAMEEPPAPLDTPMAELPSELEDIVGELLDKEEAMTDDVEDLTSSWMDSLDKGAGWDAADGPISSMSAKGVTGNRLPNEMEIGGRAGEGRTGRSHGQMVESAAEGKKGRDTPARVTPSPFEAGSVEDSSKEPTGGATGGGKLSGFTGEGLRGPTPPPRLEAMARLAGQQAVIRQEAEALALKLRGYKLPTGDLETSIGAMRDLETRAQNGDGLHVRRAFNRAVDALAEARGAIRTEIGLHRERSTLPEWTRREIMTGLRDGSPRGYEEMIAEYFRALAEEGGAAKPEVEE